MTGAPVPQGTAAAVLFEDTDEMQRRADGGVPKLIGIARDNLDSDMLVTSAGVSKDDCDMVKDVLSQHSETDFWSVRMRPAKPLAFSILNAGEGRKVCLLGLPAKQAGETVQVQMLDWTEETF